MLEKRKPDKKNEEKRDSSKKKNITSHYSISILQERDCP